MDNTIETLITVGVGGALALAGVALTLIVQGRREARERAIREAVALVGAAALAFKRLRLVWRRLHEEYKKQDRQYVPMADAAEAQGELYALRAQEAAVAAYAPDLRELAAKLVGVVRAAAEDLEMQDWPDSAEEQWRSTVRAFDEAAHALNEAIAEIYGARTKR